MRRVLGWLLVAVCSGCPEDPPIDLARSAPAQDLPAPAVVTAPRREMPRGTLPVQLPEVAGAPTLAFAPSLIIFDANQIARGLSSAPDPYAVKPVPYERPRSATPVSVAARLSDAPGDTVVFLHAPGSAIDALYLLDDRKAEDLVLAVATSGRAGQLGYHFGAADPAVRDRIEIEVRSDEVSLGEDAFTTPSAIAKGLAQAIAALRAQSSVGIEARLGVRGGTTVARLVEVLGVLARAQVESVVIVPVQDAIAHSTTGLADGRGAYPIVSLGQPNAQGDLDKAIIRRYLKRNIQKITYCYEKELLAKPALAGTVNTQFFITPAGTVSMANAAGVDTAVSTCVAAVIRQIEFPRPKGGGGVQVNFPFTFRPTGG